MNDGIIDFVTELCIKLELTISNIEGNNIRIDTDEASGLSLFIDIDNDEKISFYYSIRTHDIFYNGDRSDIHVVISLMFSAYLKLVENICVSLFDIPHPVVEGEIYGRYIVPEQISFQLQFADESALQELLKKIINPMFLWRSLFWQFVGCPCSECWKDKEIEENNHNYDLSEELKVIIRDFIGETNYGTRLKPQYEYFYNFENEVTVIKSNDLSKYFQKLCSYPNHQLQRIDGINGTLLIDGEIRNIIHHNSIKEIRQIQAKLKLKPNRLLVVPLENMLIVNSNSYIIALGRLSGLEEFNFEKDKIRKRHNKESEILFPIPLFSWCEDICANQFENLIKALLEREINVNFIRKPAPTNEGDKGRDLIIEWNIPAINQSINQPPLKTIKVVGQCKTSRKSSIGKNKVQDIRDTVETHNSEGFFLAVNTQLSAALTEKLESLKKMGIWTLWWNREDIELRLSKNPDLIPYFPQVISTHEKIKFIDRI